MKKLIISLLCSSIFLSLIGCSNTINLTEEKMNENISMTIKEGTLTKTGATVIITDTSNKNNTYGIAFRLEKKENEIWKELQQIHDDYVWNAAGYNLDENNQVELNQDWSYLYGELEKGKYRLVKNKDIEDTEYYFSVEFEIE